MGKFASVNQIVTLSPETNTRLRQLSADLRDQAARLDNMRSIKAHTPAKVLSKIAVARAAATDIEDRLEMVLNCIEEEIT